MALSDAEVEKQVRYRKSQVQAILNYYDSFLSMILQLWLEIHVLIILTHSLQINHMKKFIRQEAHEKADEIGIKVCI